LKSCANRAVERAEAPKEFHASLAAWNGLWRVYKNVLLVALR
jgi:hypothetical protein